MRDIFWSRAKPLIRKSPSFRHHSVIQYKNPFLHVFIPFISWSFCHSDLIPVKTEFPNHPFALYSFRKIVQMTQEWARMGSEWMNQVLSLYKRQHLIHSFRGHSWSFWCHFKNINNLVFFGWVWNGWMTQEWAEWGLNEWIRCCLYIRDSTWFIHSDAIPGHSVVISRILRF